MSKVRTACAAATSAAARAGTRYLDSVAVATGRQADEVIGAACSFSEDTPVATDSGFVPIGELDVGEMVLAWNQSLDSTDFYTVTAVWAHLDTTLVTLTIDGEQIETTPEHPFYIADNAWVAAGELWLGARVKKADGGVGTVSAITVVEAPQVMYNLTVETAHTYHVGEDGWLVHNACPGDRLPIRTRRGEKTRGILDTGNEEIDLISGRRGPAASMPNDTPGMRGNMSVRAHVEAHAAAVMRQEELTEATLYINNTPCDGILGCNAMLPDMLPEGATLDVQIKHGPNDWEGRQYIGKPDSDWIWPPIRKRK